MNSAIRRGKLIPAVDAILGQDYEAHKLQLYCSLVANPFAEVPSYEKFGETQESSAKSGGTVSKAQTEKLVQSSQNILQGFTPRSGGE